MKIKSIGINQVELKVDRQADMYLTDQLDKMFVEYDIEVITPNVSWKIIINIEDFFNKFVLRSAF